MSNQLTPDEARELARLCGYVLKSRNHYVRIRVIQGKPGYFNPRSLDNLYREAHAAGALVSVSENPHGTVGVKFVSYSHGTVTASFPVLVEYTPPNLAPALARALLKALQAQEEVDA